MLRVPKLFGGLGLDFSLSDEFKTPDWHRQLVYNYLHGDLYASYISGICLKGISVAKLFDRGVS